MCVFYCSFCVVGVGKVLAFTALSIPERESRILSWLVPNDAVQLALQGILIEKDVLELRPSYLPACLLDENVELQLVQRYFTSEAWVAVSNAIGAMSGVVTYYCKICDMDTKDDECIVCDACLCWMHMSCTGLSKAPKKRKWFCKTCAGQP